MNAPLCPRCEQALPFEPDGSLMYCPHCGAPQVTVSEQLLEDAQQRRFVAAERDAAPPADLVTQAATHNMLRTAALVGAIAAVLALLSVPLPPLGLLLWLWIVGAPVIALGLFTSRQRPAAVPTPGFGARLGFLSGLAVTLSVAIVNTIALLLDRFVFGKTAFLDTQLAAVFAQVHATTVAQYGAATAAPFTRLLAIPEFRAGLLLCSVSMFVVAYLVLATLGGAFAGLLRRRTTQS